MRSLYKIIFLFSLLFLTSCSILQPFADAYNSSSDFLSEDDDSNIVTVNGSGKTKQQALENSLDNAIKKVAGVLIVSEKQLKDNKLVKDIQLSYSGGYASGYDIIECFVNDRLEMFECKVRVKVNKMKVREHLYAEGNVVVIEDEYESVQTQRRNIERTSEMLRYYFSNIRTTYMNAKVKSVNFRQHPSQKNVVEVIVSFKVSVDRSYRNEVIEFLEQLQKDTGGSSNNHSFRIRYGLPFGAGEFLDNTVYLKDIGINLYNYNHRHFDVLINPFNECVSGYHLHSGVLSFKSETYDYKFYINKSQLENAKNLSVQMSECSQPIGFSWE